MSTKKKNPPVRKPSTGKNAVEIITPLNKINSGNNKMLFIYSLILGIFAFLLYLNTCRNGFILDDINCITSNNFVKGGNAGIWKILVSEYRAGFWSFNGNLYRPLPLIIFNVLWQISPENPLPFHVFNCIIFAFTAIVLFLLLRKLFSNHSVLIPVLITLLFIVHPVHTEAVANIKSLDELLSLFFALFGCFMIVLYIEKQKIVYLFYLFLSYFMALFSKEGAITFVVLFPALTYFFTNAKKKDFILTTSFFIAPAVFYLIIRNYVLTHQTGNIDVLQVIDNSIIGAKDFGEKTASSFYLLGKYLLMSIFPKSLSVDYSYNEIPLVTWSNIFAILSFIVYVSLGIIVLLRRKLKEAWVFGIVFYLISISLYSNLFYVIGTNFAERLLYIPTLGICITSVLLMEKLLNFICLKYGMFKHSNNYLSFIIIILVITGSIKTFSRNTEWKDELTLYKHDIINTPNSAHLNYWLANEIYSETSRKKLTDSELMTHNNLAIGYLTRAIEIYPIYSDAYSLRGKIYYQRNMTDSAMTDYKNAVKNKAPFWTIYSDLGMIYAKRNQLDSAAYFFKQALLLDSKQAFVYENLAVVCQLNKNYEEAISYLREALHIDPNNAGFYKAIAVNYHLMKQYKEAIENYELALRHLTSNDLPLKKEIYRNLVFVYKSIGDPLNVKKYQEPTE